MLPSVPHSGAGVATRDDTAATLLLPGGARRVATRDDTCRIPARGAAPVLVLDAEVRAAPLSAANVVARALTGNITGEAVAVSAALPAIDAGTPAGIAKEAPEDDAAAEEDPQACASGAAPAVKVGSADCAVAAAELGVAKRATEVNADGRTFTKQYFSKDLANEGHCHSDRIRAN